MQKEQRLRTTESIGSQMLKITLGNPVRMDGLNRYKEDTGWNQKSL